MAFRKISIGHVIDEWIAEASKNAVEESDRLSVTGWFDELADQSHRDAAARQAERRSIGQSLRGLALIVSPPKPVPTEQTE
jgi:hypothetical protein